MNDQTDKIVISTNTAWYAYIFRMPLIRALQSAGYAVTVVAPLDDYSKKLTEAGCEFVPIGLNNKSTNPVTELLAVYSFYKIYRRLKPMALLNFTPKPTIYGSIAARILNIPCVNNITGLGTAFAKSGLLSFIVKKMYRFSQGSVVRVFFQNRDDKKLFISSQIINESQTDLLPGSGVELDKFTPVQKEDTGTVLFLLISRLIWFKGVGDFADAARIIRRKYPQARFQLLGYVDNNTPNEVPESQIREWEREGILEWVGRQDDVIPFIGQSDCLVLPSYYREGTPRTLLEGAAMAKPLIAADTIGCREPVEDGKTGFLCKPKNPEDLAEKMERIILMGHEKRREMGRAGREKMEKEYDINIVLKKYMEVIESIKVKNGTTTAS